MQGSNPWPSPWVGTVDLWVLHIDSLRRIFDQSLMKIFHRVQEIWSGQESVMEGQTDGGTDKQTDEGHFYNPSYASQQRIDNLKSFKNRISLKLVLQGISRVANYIVAYEQVHWNQAYCFRILQFFLGFQRIPSSQNLSTVFAHTCLFKYFENILQLFS